MPEEWVAQNPPSKGDEDILQGAVRLQKTGSFRLEKAETMKPQFLVLAAERRLRLACAAAAAAVLIAPNNSAFIELAK